MSSAVHVLNTVVTAIFDVISWPLMSLSPFWALAVLSLMAGPAMVWVFGRFSNQDAIGTTRDRIHGNLLGARLYREDPRAVLRLHAQIFRDTGTYLRLALPPLLVLLIPVVLTLAQLQLRLGVSPLPPGQTALVQVYVRDAALLNGPLRLEVPSGVVLESPPVRVVEQRAVSWRVRAVESGRHTLKVRLADTEADTTLVVGEEWGAVPQRRTGNAWDLLLNPGEPPIGPTSAIETIQITYPALEDLSLAGWPLHWSIWFLGLTLVFGYGLKGVIGVEL